MAHNNNSFVNNLRLAEELQDLYDLEEHSEWESVRKSKSLRQSRLAEAKAKTSLVEVQAEATEPVTEYSLLDLVVDYFDSIGVKTEVYVLEEEEA